MLDAGLVRESDKRVDPEMDDERRIYYQITVGAAEALAGELDALPAHCYDRAATEAVPEDLCI